MTDYDFDSWADGLAWGYSDALNRRFDETSYSIASCTEFSLGYREGYDRVMNQPGRFGTGFMLFTYMNEWAKNEVAHLLGERLGLVLARSGEIHTYVGNISRQMALSIPFQFMSEDDYKIHMLLRKVEERLQG